MFYSNKYPRSVFRELQDFPYTKRTRSAIYNSTKASEDFVQRLKLVTRLPVHNGCVNCICWNEKGTKILSGSDDQHLTITDPFTYQVLTDYRTNHRANIFSAKFLPNCGDSAIISCSGEGSILYTDLSRIEETQDCLFNCHHGTTYDVVTIPNDPNVFLSCGEDYTVRSFDLRVKNKCNKVKCKEDVIIQCRRAVTAITVNQLMPCQIAVGCADSSVRIYDRRMVEGVKTRLNPVEAYIAPGLEKKSHRITSINFSPEGDDLLVSYSSEHVYLFGVRNTKETVYSLDSICGSDDEEGEMGAWCSNGKGDNVPVRRLRLRGDWSDTGPDARPHSNTSTSAAQGGRRAIQGGLIQRMTDVLSRMLNDPATRAALSQGGESDQMQLEEGLEEYLDVNSRRRASDGNIAESSGVNDTLRIVHSEHNSEDRADQNDEQIEVNQPEQSANTADNSMEQSEVNPEESSDVSMDVVNQENDLSPANPSHDRTSLSSGQNTEASCEDYCSRSAFQPYSSQSSYSDNEVQNMETDDSDPSNANLVYLNQNDISYVPLVPPIPSHIEGNSMEVPVDASNEISLSSTDCEQNSDEVLQSQSQADNDASSAQAAEQSDPQNQESDSTSGPSNANQPTQQQNDDDSLPSTSNDGTALTDLTDELSTMFHGFKERYGKKPMVNLVYSVRGSTASTISMTVDDQVINTSPNSHVRLGFLDEPVRVIRVPPRERREETDPNQPSSSNSETIPSTTSSSSTSSSDSSPLNSTPLIPQTTCVSPSSSAVSSSSLPSPLITSSTTVMSSPSIPTTTTSSLHNSLSSMPAAPITSTATHTVTRLFMKFKPIAPSPPSSSSRRRSSSSMTPLASSSTSTTDSFSSPLISSSTVNPPIPSSSSDSTIDTSSTTSSLTPSLTCTSSDPSIPTEEPTSTDTPSTSDNPTASSTSPSTSDPPPSTSDPPPNPLVVSVPSASTTSDPSLTVPPSTSSSDPSLPHTAASTRFAVCMEKELCKAIRTARGEVNPEEKVKMKKAYIRMSYYGHRNARTMIKEATFWGSDYVMSGSDCGHVFIWGRDTGKLTMTLQADNHVVNCLQPHPTLPILATSGIDYDLKLWAPLASAPCFDYAATQELMHRNAIMLEETKDTITVPASFMIRMLACLNQLRRGGPRALRRRRQPDE